MGGEGGSARQREQETSYKDMGHIVEQNEARPKITSQAHGPLPAMALYCIDSPIPSRSHLVRTLPRYKPAAAGASTTRLQLTASSLLQVHTAKPRRSFCTVSSQRPLRAVHSRGRG